MARTNNRNRAIALIGSLSTSTAGVVADLLTHLVSASNDEDVSDMETATSTRAARRAAKQSPEGKAFLAASRAVSKALEAAHEAKDQAMAEALQAALGSLAQHAKAAGIEPRSLKEPKAA